MELKDLTSEQIDFLLNAIEKESYSIWDDPSAFNIEVYDEDDNELEDIDDIVQEYIDRVVTPIKNMLNGSRN